MTASTHPDQDAPTLRCGIVLRVSELACELVAGGRIVTAGYASQFPSPRTERVAPGHLVAVATAPTGGEFVVWRWYDAVVLDVHEGLVRLWEPAHGEVDARPRDAQHRYTPGTRAYLSAGLPGAEWWVEGDAAGSAESAEVELGAVHHLYNEHDLWRTAFER